MTFPQTPLNILVEIELDAVWTDITAYVMRDQIQIQRGRADESAQVETSTCTLTLNNRDGRFSPRNPLSPYYGVLGRNTPIRVSLPDLAAADEKRFTGEVSAWPQKWDTTGTDVYVTIECAGILRRLGQGVAPKTATYKDYILSTNPYGYWPLDEGIRGKRGQNIGLSSKAYTVEWNQRYSISWGQGNLGERFEPGLRINDLDGNGTLWVSPKMANVITAYAFDFVYQTEGIGTFVLWLFEVDFPLSLPTPTDDNKRWILLGLPNGSEAFKLDYASASNGLTTEENDAENAALSLNEVHHARFQVTENGANVDWKFYLDGTLLYSGTVTGEVVNGLRQVLIAFDATTDKPFHIGHIATWNVGGTVGDDPPAIADVYDAFSGYDGETAGNRISRLCTEAGIPLTTAGTLADTTEMGPQGADKDLVSLLRECAEADGGILYEPRDAVGLAYRTRKHLYNQAATVAFDYSGAVFAAVPEPVDDDQALRNKVTATRTSGGSYEAELTSGALSTQAPPDGVGVYASSSEVNVFSDAMLPAQAWWRTNQGTIDKARYPQIALNLARSVFTSNATLTGNTASLDIGDYLTITNPPDWLPPDQVDLLAQGFTETLHNFSWDIAVNCTPGDRYLIPLFEAATPPETGNERARFDSEGATLAVAIDTDDTSLTVDTTWTAWNPDNAEDGFDIIIGGERMTVTDITALSGDDHTFTVTRSVNGIVKSHSIGAEVRLFLTPTFGL